MTDNESILKKYSGQELYIGKTIDPAAENLSSGKSGMRKLVPGEVVGDGYTVYSPMEMQGNQADVFLVKKEGVSYVLKIYRSNEKPQRGLLDFLKKAQHSNLVQLKDAGMYCGHFYEISEYYPEGSLEKINNPDPAYLSEIIIPQISEGLHYLHSNGIIHCDLKPENIFLSDSGHAVHIGDFGVSLYMDDHNEVIAAVRGTPEYAPMTSSVGTSVVYTPAYDYGSLGFVVLKLVSGRSVFEGMSAHQLAIAKHGEITVPGYVDRRLADLIKGLINNSEEQRWGYLQIKNWCGGAHVQTTSQKTADRRKGEKASLVFGRIDGKLIIVETMRQLETALRSHYDQAKNVIRQNQTVDFIAQNAPQLKRKAEEIRRLRDDDEAVYKMLKLISESHAITYMGKTYKNPQEVMNGLVSGDPAAIRFVGRGLLIYELRENNYDRSLVDRLEKMIRDMDMNNPSSLHAIAYALKEEKYCTIHGRRITTAGELINLLESFSVAEMIELTKDPDFLAWLYSKGYMEEVKRLQSM